MLKSLPGNIQTLQRHLTPGLLSLCLWVALGFGIGGCGSSESHPGTSIQAGQRSEVSAVLAASEMVVGENRFPFGLFTAEGQFIEGAQVHVQFYRLHDDGPDELKAEADATFRHIQEVTHRIHQDGQAHSHLELRGVYTVDRMDFDELGIWEARLEIVAKDYSITPMGTLAFQVVARSATLQPGDSVPPSRNPTARDVADLTEITTHHPPVPGLYQLTVAEALQEHTPLVVVFATPAFCGTGMCGPVTDVVAQVYERYNDGVNFIHIEPWKLEVARNEGRLVPTDVAVKWGLPSEPWVFVIDDQGRVFARFEGLVTVEELSKVLETVIQPAQG